MTCEECGASSLTVPIESARPASPAELPGQPLAQEQLAQPLSATKALKRIKVRFDGPCADCECPLPAGSSAWWETATKTLRCPACAGFAGVGAPAPPSVAPRPVADRVALAPEAAPAAKPSGRLDGSIRNVRSPGLGEVGEELEHLFRLSSLIRG